MNPSKDFVTLHDMALKAQPAWLCVPTEYMSLLLDGIEGTDAEKPGRLKKVLLEKFQYMKKPPRWVQGAEWPIVEVEPLFFIGQMDISPLSHDTAHLFIFYDKRNKRFHNIVQSA